MTKMEYLLLVKNEKGQPVFYLGPIDHPMLYAKAHRYVHSRDMVATFPVRDFKGRLMADKTVSQAWSSWRIPSWPAFVRFQELNKIDDEAIEVSLDSIDFFYRFDEKYSVNLTKDFVYQWWNYDCPFLYRFRTNKDDGRTMFGNRSSVFFGTMIEPSMQRYYFDDVTAEEVGKLFGDHPGTLGAKDAENYLSANTISQEKINAMMNVITDYDKKIQEVIDNHRDLIVSESKGTPDSYPCGFMSIYVRADDWEEARRLIQQLPDERKNGFSFYGDCHLSWPIHCQGLDLQYKQFETIKRVVKEDLGIELYKTGVWD